MKKNIRTLSGNATRMREISAIEVKPIQKTHVG